MGKVHRVRQVAVERSENPGDWRFLPLPGSYEIGVRRCKSGMGLSKFRSQRSERNVRPTREHSSHGFMEQFVQFPLIESACGKTLQNREVWLATGFVNVCRLLGSIDTI